MIDFSCIIVHTCGVERHGKGYKLIGTDMRPLGEHTFSMLTYVYHNYGLINPIAVRMPIFSDFVSGFLDDEDSQIYECSIEEENNQLLEDVECEEEDDDEEEEEEDNDDDEESTDFPSPISLPRGYYPMDKPLSLDSSLVGMLIFFKWPEDGWGLGKFTNHWTPPSRYAKKYNYEIKYAGESGPRDQKLSLELYGFGDDLPDSSWVVLKKI